MKKLFASLALAASLSIATHSVNAEELIRGQVSAPGSTAFVVTTHLSNVLKQRHGYSMEVATGFPGVRSMVNNANYETELSIYAPALAFFLNKEIAMFKDLQNHAVAKFGSRYFFGHH